eukprot:1082956-Amphidinium_carterae.2
MEHPERMIAEARNLSQHAANEQVLGSNSAQCPVALESACSSARGVIGVSFNVLNVLLATPLKPDNPFVEEHFALSVSRFVVHAHASGDYRDLLPVRSAISWLKAQARVAEQ